MRRLFLNYYLFLVFVLVLVWFAAVPVVEHFASAPFREDYDRYYRELTRGTFSLVAEELRRVPEAEWSGRLEEIRPRFGYPLELQSLEELSGADGAPFDASRVDQLRHGRIVVGRTYDQFWQRLPGSDTVLMMGPFPAPAVGSSVDLWTWALLLLFLGAATTVWALPFARKMREFRRTAAEFGEGRFEVRASMPAHSPLAPLATSFNRMADRIEQLVTSHRDLTNAVAHELRTPISRLRFGLEMAGATDDPDKRAHYAAGLQHDVEELEALVEELLVYARFDRTGPQLDREERPLAPWLHERLEALVADTRSTLQWDLDGAGERPVGFDPRQLGRALDNLVLNADRYGHGRIHVRAWVGDGAAGIDVEDDGPGIPVSERERVFEPFTRLDSSRSRESGGFGLGLAIVRRVIRAHGGEVAIEDAELGGSRFRLRWPLAST